MRPTPTMPTRSFFPVVMNVTCAPWASWFCPPTRLYLRLEHGSERLAGIGELAGVDRHLALDQPPHHRHVALRIDAQRVREVGAVELEQERGAHVERPAYARAWLCNGPAHALDIHVVLLRPERGRDLVHDIAAGGIASRDRAVLLGMPPVLQPHRPVRSGKERTVAGPEDRHIAGAAMVVDHDAVLRGETRDLRPPLVGRDPGADHDEVGCDGVAAAGVDAEPAIRQFAQRGDGGTDADIDAADAVALVDQLGDGGFTQ